MTTPLPVPAKVSPLAVMGERYQIEPARLLEVLKATVIKPDKNGRLASNEEIAAFVIVANQYELNPFTREIYAFVSQGGSVIPIVGVDGWAHIVNQREAFDGCSFAHEFNETGQLIAVTCSMHAKGRSHPVEVTEWFSECYRKANVVWQTMPRRMLRHRAFMQAARLCFGLTGIYDEDEARDIMLREANEQQVQKPPVGRVNTRRQLQPQGPPKPTDAHESLPQAQAEPEAASPDPEPSADELEQLEAQPEAEAQAQQGGVADLADDLVDEIAQAQSHAELQVCTKKMEQLQIVLGRHYPRVLEASQLRASQFKHFAPKK